MNKNQKIILNHLYKTRGSFRVACYTSYGFWQYYKYPSKDASYHLNRDNLTDRDIMNDEIVIETDMNMRKMNRAVSEFHERKLIANNISYKKYWSGNKSYHIHIFFPELQFIVNDFNRKLLKRLFIFWLYGIIDAIEPYKSLRMKRLSGHKVDLQLCGKHLIRLEYSRHTSTGNVKRLVSENVTSEVNKLPFKVWKQYIKDKQKNNNNHKRLHLSSMKCIGYFLNNPLGDCRKRIAFVLFNNLKNSVGIETASNILRSWSDEQDLQPSIVENIISYHANNNQCPKCPYIKDLLMELGLNICEECEYGER